MAICEALAEAGEVLVGLRVTTTVPRPGMKTVGLKDFNQDGSAHLTLQFQ